MSTAAADAASPLEQARGLARSGRLAEAEARVRALLERQPGDARAMTAMAEFALSRGQQEAAIVWLQSAARANPDDPQHGIDLATAYMRLQQRAEAQAALETTVDRLPGAFMAWLMLGALHKGAGRESEARRAWFQAVTRAQRSGHWVDQARTPPDLLPLVVHAIETVRSGRRLLLLESYQALRDEFGPAALARVDRAVTGYLREWDATPTDPRQRPNFFFFPDLPNTPYHDPYLQPWAARLQAGFDVLRADALRVLEEDRRLPDFVPEGGDVASVVSGDGPAPSWEAFFFYRHGERFDDNHRRCPATSALLESIELCRIEEQAPEILFSVLKPGSHINPHHGVSNVRLVMHLPLQVPPDCALNLIDRGQHVWQEGRLVMFDDTYLHEAWNRSSQTRVILLMDCWNPHLTSPEKRAVKALIETITGLHMADRATELAQRQAA